MHVKLTEYKISELQLEVDVKYESKGDFWVAKAAWKDKNGRVVYWDTQPVLEQPSPAGMRRLIKFFEDQFFDWIHKAGSLDEYHSMLYPLGKDDLLLVELSRRPFEETALEQYLKIDKRHVQ